MPALTPTGEDVDALLDAVPGEQQRADARALRDLLQDVTGEPPLVWASRMLGFGRYRYRYDSGHRGEAPLLALAVAKGRPRLTLHLAGGFADRHGDLTSRLGAHTHGVGCLYLRRLADVDLDVLRELLARSARELREADVS